VTLRGADGYEACSYAGSEGFVWSAGTDWLAATLAGGHTLHGWAAGHEHVVSFTGRGTVHAVPAPALGPDRRDHWVVRHYRRGGAVTRYLDDRYLATGDSRPIRELKACVEARKRGVPTPAVVAGATYSAGMFYRADLATELIPDAESLRDLLFGNSDSQVDVESALHIAGKVVRKLEDTCVLHPDVNAGNILLRVHLAETEAHVIDLDRCNIVTQAVPGPHHFMRERLERSLRGLADRHAVELPDGCWRALRDGFGESS
jgi:3-deoxy-D-manno-octulosonic acid kinase